jgi:hypothetical protein
MTEDIGTRAWPRRAGVLAAVLGLGLIVGLGIGRTVESASANPAGALLPTDSMWVLDGPLAQIRERQMDEVASMIKEALQLDPEQAAEFDRIDGRVRSEIHQAIADIAPDIAAIVQASAAELRAILNEEQIERLIEMRSSGMPVPGGS